VDSKKLLLIGGIGAAAIIGYIWLRNKQATQSLQQGGGQMPLGYGGTNTLSAPKTIPGNVTAWINSMNDPGKTLWSSAVNSWFTQQDVNNLSSAITYFSSNTLMPGPLNDWWNAIANKVG